MPGNDQNNNAASASPSFEVKVNGAAIPAEYNMVSMMVYHAVNRLSYAKFIFLDGDASKGDFPLSNKPDFLPGAAVEIAAGYKGQNQTIFKGIVIKHSVKLKENKSTFLLVECRHAAVKATKTRKNKIFTEQKDSDIFSSILQRYSINADATDTKVEHKEMVQFNCTDWDFMISRAEANSMLVITDNGKLKLSKPDLAATAVMELKFGNNLLEFDAEMDARYQFDTVKAMGWDPATQEAVETEGTVPSGFQQQGNVSSSDLASKTGDAAIDYKNAAPLTETELRAWADAQMMKHSLSKVRGRAKCQGSDKLKCGVIANLQGAGERFNGKTFISAVRHEINQGNWLTDVEFGLSSQLFITEHDVNPFPAAGLLPGVNGLQAGVVTQLEDDPLGEDRVLVKMPLVDKDAEGIWARHALPDAGDSRGSFFRPEVGDEVVLGFINDDPRHAVILGMLNSSAKPAVIQAKDTNHEKGFVTREKMTIWFNDEKKTIEISTPAGNSIKLDEDGKQIALKDQHGNEITMSKDGITIKSIKDLTLDAASGKIGISGKELEASGSTTAKVKGSSSAEISSSGSTTVKGSSVMIN
ncbi:type VI secretion system tip protein VgrG [Segetibacter aerophilus]|uniref:Type IV secretion protein Rhs n=1 Tax=Segetibacter aerophilus TaxID=670293 RepID=A0A512BIY2_9BACT|nr:type VI secretion system tip protein VgrG [Segetibacter aerophilus]GEO11932.1 type IV secretion protein Rhs [Segetibacter aerophilus]